MGCNKDRLYLDCMAVHPEVTGSSNQQVVKLPNGQTIQFVVDCGLFQGEYPELNRILRYKPENLDFALVTHNHVDHTGRLPLLAKKGFRGNIYTSKDTATLMPTALEDSQKILREVSKKSGEKVLYDETDLLKTEALVSPMNFYETKKINDFVEITFLKNGHLLGAALILVQVKYPEYEPINLLFTGDYNNKNMFFDVPPIPEWILDLPLTVVIESTYGDMESSNMKPVFEENVLKCIQNQGTVVAPVFSLGRSQEILYVVKHMQDSGELDKSVQIYFDGKLAIKYTNMYLKEGLLDIKPEMRDFLPENLTFVNKANRAEVLENNDRKIILTSSGMGSYGPAQLYIPRFIRDKNSLIHFTGYTSDDTLGGRLKNTNKGEDVEVGGLMVKKLADVEYTREYSAHAKADELIAFLKQFKNLKLVLVNHGNENVKQKFAKRILNEVNPKDVGILGGDYFFRVNPYGLVKTLPSKFK